MELKKLLGVALAATMVAFSGMPVASAEDEEEEEEVVLVVDEPVESGDILVTEDGDVYEVQ